MGFKSKKKRIDIYSVLSNNLIVFATLNKTIGVNEEILRYIATVYKICESLAKEDGLSVIRLLESNASEIGLRIDLN
mgnify:CR=1 FL=1